MDSHFLMLSLCNELKKNNSAMHKSYIHGDTVRELWLMFTTNIRIRKRCEVGIVGARDDGLSRSETADVLGPSYISL